MKINDNRKGFNMKIKRLISSVITVALVISSLSFSASADLSKRPGEVGYVPYGMRQYSDDFNFTDKPYSLTSGDYYMGLSIQTANWAFRDAIGTPDTKGQDALNVNNEAVRGMNPYSPWSRFFMNIYAMIDRDKNGVELKSPIGAYGPAGLMTEANKNGEREITEYTQLHDAKIVGSGTYTVGIQGFNFKADTAENYEGEHGNGINQLFISSNIQYLKNNGVTISNPVLKLYNTKAEYEAKTPYKSIPAGFWITGKGANITGYTQYTFTNNWAKDGDKDIQNGRIFNIPAQYQDNTHHLDAFQISGFTGNASSDFATGYEGCQFLPEYAMEITFDVNMPFDDSKSITSYSNEKVVSLVKPPKTSIKTKKATIKKLTATKKRTLKVIWKKVSGARGYEIKLATNRKFTKNKRTVNKKSGLATNKTIKKLISGKKYFVKIRAYTIVKGKKQYSKWSKIKSTKIKAAIKKRKTTKNVSYTTSAIPYGSTYVLNSDSMKVHKSGCRTFKYESQYPTTDDLYWALSNGYSLCGVCLR